MLFDSIKFGSVLLHERVRSTTSPILKRVRKRGREWKIVQRVKRLQRVKLEQKREREERECIECRE